MLGWSNKDTARVEKGFYRMEMFVRKKAREMRSLNDKEFFFINSTGSAAVDGMNVGEFGIHGISLQNIEENHDDLVDPEEEMEGEIEGAIEEGEDIILQVVNNETKTKT
ncbi:hypothetical protein JTB14_006259 [Gonioctena quinquepunctata]|nr:hypothetical protein JTB14_006259 [Gonioctena quinquepunctata]